MTYDDARRIVAEALFHGFHRNSPARCSSDPTFDDFEKAVEAVIEEAVERVAKRLSGAHLKPAKPCDKYMPWRLSSEITLSFAVPPGVELTCATCGYSREDHGP